MISGAELKPTIGGLFVMISAPAKFEKGKTYSVSFRAGQAKDEPKTAANEGPSAPKSTGRLRLPVAHASTQPFYDASITENVSLLPVAYRPQAIQALAIADRNAGELLKAIAAVPAEHREALAFLLVHMPSDDLQSLKSDFLLENIDYAYCARRSAAWGSDLSDELFFNDVLPYANVNERRDDWRKDFYEKYSAAVKECRTPGEAALVLNKAVFEKTGVKYHPTKRPKPDQSPSESIEAGYASCTGLSILLVDACRAVGVPARVVGTQWTNTAGNHTWVEVWNRQWNYLGAAEPSPLNQTWFAANAAAADGARAEKRIYAASWLKTGTEFPLVWAPDYKDAAAYDVTPFYTARETARIAVLDKLAGHPQKAAITVRLDGVLVAAAPSDSSFRFDLARGQKYVAQLSPTDGKTVTREFTLSTKDKADVTLSLAD